MLECSETYETRHQGVSPIRGPLPKVPNGRNQGAKPRRGGFPGEHLQRGVRPFGASPEGLRLPMGPFQRQRRGSLIDDTP